VVSWLVGVAVFSLLHFLGSFALRLSLGFYDTWEDRGERTVLWEAGRIVLLILWFPGLQIVKALHVNGWAVLIGNSLLWGVALFALFVAIMRLLGVGPAQWSGQFSMRTLLLTTTAAAILLGVVGWVARNL
jgi:hypothetical protein